MTPSGELPATQDRLSAAGDGRRNLLWAVWGGAAGFGAYFCMYAVRKPYTAATFADATLWGLGFKIVLVTLQTIGYMLSKFLGIAVVSEMPRQRRALGVLCLVLIAEATLILFGLIPRPWNALCFLLNGLPLGMVFGVIVGLLEGRRMTEAMTAGLCASFILADGVMKSVGGWLLAQGVAEDWMPATAGGLFLIPLGVCVLMLARIPPPTSEDVEARAMRAIMNREARWSFLTRHAVGLIPLVVIYLLVTIVRSMRADFAPEIWKGLGSAAPSLVYTQSESLVMLGVLAVNGGAVLIRDNRRAFFASLATCGVGFALIAAALVGRSQALLDGFGFMVLIGLGLYFPYVAIHTTVFERLLAMTRERGNIAFPLYVADAVGYLGYVVIMIVRNYGNLGGDLLNQLIGVCWLTIGASAVCLVLCWRHFACYRATIEVEGGDSPALNGVEG